MLTRALAAPTQDICAAMGGGLATVSDQRTSRFLSRLMADAGVDEAFLGMFKSPDAELVLPPEEGWAWASGEGSFNGTDHNYRNWSPSDSTQPGELWQLSQPIVSSPFHSNW